jgi:hypothetical protein
MQSTFRTRGATLAGLLVLAMAALTPSLAEAKPEPGAKRGFRLFARPLGAMTINRVLCGLTSTGEICVDSTNSSTIGGGFWPKGTADQYVFNTGLQLAGIIGSDGGPWAGDTTGAFFFDPKGTTQHGIEVRPIYNSVSSADAANWPDAARVPCTSAAVSANCLANPSAGPDSVGGFYSPLLQGRVNGSQGDVWFMTWEGSPALNSGRPHPMGIVVETRGLGWNFPSGNEDIIYFVYTFYNVTSLDPLAYGTMRPAMSSIMQEQATSFHALNNAGFNVTLPVGGYTIDPLYAAFATDMDVADAGTNYASVNLPFALGDTYDRTFGRFAGWTFDPAIFSAPFFAGSGFVGVKYLSSPAATGATTYAGPGEIQLFGNTENGGFFGDPQNTTQLYRYLSGNISTAAGDAPCNTGDPTVTRICYVNNSRPFDMRFFQSSTPLALPAGGYGSIVVAYVFAAPVDGICAPPCDITPGDVEVISDPARAGNPALVPDQQKLAGYLSWSDVNGNSRVEQDEFVVVPGSLLGKALTAQAVFDSKFLLPFSPESPDFFLIPGDNSVTVMWRQSPSEQTGDPFYQVARFAQIGGSVNPLYDANYREFDVEGYRVYRGRVDSPNELSLIGQFDFAGTALADYGGQVDYGPLCAPELGVVTACAAPYNLAEFAPGVQRTVFAPIALNQVGNTINQVKFGERTLLADGTAFVLTSDTAVVGLGGSCAPSACPPLRDNGVPFFMVDDQVRNNFRYFYSVTAFDVNSWQSGPTNLESPRITKPVVPTKPATNYSTGGTPGPTAMFGRGVQLDPTAPVPPLDPTTGVWGGPMPPADGWDIQIAEFISTVMPSTGTFNARLDSVRLGNAWGSSDEVNTYYWTGIVNPPVVFTLASFQPFLDDDAVAATSLTYPAATTDASLAGRYGGDGGYFIQGQTSISTPGIYVTNGTGRSASLAFGDGAQFESDWDGSFYDGPRWFEGTESFANPTGGFCAPNCTVTNWNNAGNLAGVTSIHQPASYTTMNFGFREFQGALGGASRAADVEVHWGAAGVVDSVVDVTHNVLVPFKAGNFRNPQGTLVDAGIGLSWGFLNTAGQASGGEFNNDPAAVSIYDFACLNPIWVDTHIRAPCGLSPGAGDDPMFLESTAAISTQGYVTGSFGAAYTRTAPGIAMYMLGNIFQFEMGALPAAGTVWTMRDHIGGIYGGKGTDVDQVTVINDAGPYGFHSFTRPMTAAGVELQGSFTAVNEITRITSDDIANVHPVPDPLYITSEFDNSATEVRIEFINMPAQAIIRIYSSSGVLVDLLEHDSEQAGGSLTWGVRNRNQQVVASGVYFYHIESNDQRRVGRMTIVRYTE